MKPAHLRDMLEATKLTGSGRLTEATALIQRLLSNPQPIPPAPATDAIEPEVLAADAVIDLVPEDGQWRAAQPGKAKEPISRERASTGRFEEEMYSGASGQRAYKVYVPSGYTGDPLPLVVMLHGCTQSPDDFAAGTQMNVLADEQNFLVAYPAQSRSANAQKCWNWFNAADQKKSSGESALIADITRKIMADHSVDPQRVYVAGMSAGGAMAAVLGMNHPDLFAAIGVHSGLPCGAAKDMSSALMAMQRGGGAPRSESGSSVPTIVFHGDQDRTVHPANANGVIAQFGGEAGQAEAASGKSPGGLAYTRSVHSNAEGNPALEQWAIHGAGHAWSGGSPDGSYTEPKGPDASREMIRFFLSHTLGS